jgi:hypothetical protein
MKNHLSLLSKFGFVMIQYTLQHGPSNNIYCKFLISNCNVMCVLSYGDYSNSIYVLTFSRLFMGQHG